MTWYDYFTPTEYYCVMQRFVVVVRIVPGSKSINNNIGVFLKLI